MRESEDRKTPGLAVGVLCSAALALMLAAAVRAEATYTVDIRPDLDGLDIKIEPVAQTGILVVQLTNKSDKKVRCDLRYDAAPQALLRKSTYIDPGKTEVSDFRAKRKWFSVTVDVKCRAVDATKE